MPTQPKTLFPIRAPQTPNSRGPRIVAWLFGLLLVLVSATAPALLTAQQITRPFPFTIPTLDNTDSPNLPQLPSELAGAHGALAIDSNGHIRAKDGTRLKFFGTTLAVTSQFLLGSEAKLVAHRLRKLGFNAVRFIYNDYYNYDAASFFKYRDSQNKPNLSSYVVNPAQFAKFDTLLYELKKNGIYAFFVLSSVHQFTAAEGVIHPDSAYYGANLLEFFDPEVASLERQWAKTFLGHVNPLTGIRLADDPQLAVIEFVNEHSLYYYWTLDRLNYIDEANKLTKGKSTISYLQSKFLDTAYSLFLRNKYGSDQKVEAGWVGTAEVNTANLMQNASFENPGDPSWTLSTRDNASAFIVNADGGVDSSVYVKLRIKTLGASKAASSISYTNVSARLGFDSLYEMTFWAKMGYDNTRPTVTARNVGLLVSQFTSGSPRSLQTTVQIDTLWRKYSFVFRCAVGGLQNIQFQAGAELGDVWLDAVHVHHKAETGLVAGESISSSTVQRLLYHGLALAPLQRIRDQVLFYDSIEVAFYETMRHVVKDTMKFQGLVNYTQTNYWFSLVDVEKLSLGDVAEVHSAWDYMGARAGTNYSDSTWMIRNYSMVKSKYAGSLAGIAANACAGKGFVLSDYEMPIANQSLSEQMVLLPAYASYQDWDGIFFGPYAYYRQELFSDSIMNPFKTSSTSSSIVNNPALLALAPAASKIFREGLVHPAEYTASLLHDPDDVWLAPTYSRGAFGVEGNLDNNVCTAIGIRQHFGDSVHRVAAQYPYLADTAAKRSDTDELLWDETNGLFTIKGPNVIGATGYFSADTTRLGALEFSREDASTGILSLLYVPLDSMPLGRSRSALLSLSTRAQNSGVVWSDTTTFGRNWGTAPTVMSAARVNLIFKNEYDSTFVTPLDGTGHAMMAPMLAPRIDDSTSSLTIDQAVVPTTWFLVTQSSLTTHGLVASRDGGSMDLLVRNNPAHESAIIRYISTRDEEVALTLVDDLGRTTQVITSGRLAPGSHEFRFTTSRLATGHYIVRAETPSGMLSREMSVVK